MIPKYTLRELGPIEANIVGRLTYEKKTIVTTRELDDLFKLSPEDRKQVVFRLKKKNRLTPIKPGVYVFSPLEAGPAGRGINPFLIPPVFFRKRNYYIGYSSMYNFYGFTEQLFQTLYILNTSISKEKVICGVPCKFAKISEDRMYGLEPVKIEGQDILVSSKERTMIDLLYFNKPVGGIETAVEIVSRIVTSKKCDTQKLVEYALRFPNITIRKRVGVLLEKTGIPEVLLKSLAKSVENTALSSFGKSRKGEISKKWKAIIDDSQQ
jgi:predicted transcriptional regulator of viral defense system